MTQGLKPWLRAGAMAGILLGCSGGPLLARFPFQETTNADKAKNDQSDRTLMRSIRRDVVKDKTLSTSAHNVKIIAANGKVTLRGPVESENEKKAVEEHATKYAGAGNVVNELTVKGS
jgi:hyperosmotically inducible protein